MAFYFVLFRISSEKLDVFSADAFYTSFFPTAADAVAATRLQFNRALPNMNSTNEHRIIAMYRVVHSIKLVRLHSYQVEMLNKQTDLRAYISNGSRYHLKSKLDQASKRMTEGEREREKKKN